MLLPSPWRPFIVHHPPQDLNTRPDASGVFVPDSLQGACIGVLMLDTRFPRWPGDIGHPDTLGASGRFRRIPGAVVDTVVRRGRPDPMLCERFIALADELVDEGADAIVTSCGFLQIMQAQLQSRLAVPCVCSALSLLSDDQSRSGVLTFDSTRLTDDHLPDTVTKASLMVEGMQDSELFHAVIAEDRPEANFDAMTRDVHVVAQRMARRRPRQVVLECTNLSPWKPALTAYFGVPVFDILDALAIRVGTASPSPLSF